ncbi:MAG: TetR/AcrR family transcriptional regulator [Mycobacterium sp.]
MTDLQPSPDAPPDPRIERTRAHVLKHARRLIATAGPTSVTYSELAAETRVTRQTLYRHWPTREALFVDLVLQQSMDGLPNGSGSAAQIVGGFLRRLRDDMDDPANAGPLVALIATADHQPASDSALGHVVVTVCDALNALVAPSGRQVTPDDYARLCGPVIFRRLIAREVVTDLFIDVLVADWLSSSEHAANPDATSADVP